MALGFVNFANDTLGALPSYLTVEDTAATGTATVEEYAGSLSGQALRVRRTAGGFRQLISVNTADDLDPDDTWCEVSALVRIDGNFAQCGVAACINDAQASDPTAIMHNIYNTNAGVAIYASSSTTPSSIDAGTSHSATASYATGPKRLWMRFRFIFNTGAGNWDVKMKDWDVDAESEPGWSREITGDSFNVDGAGPPGVFSLLQGGAFGDDFVVEAIGWSTDVDTDGEAPLEPVSSGGGSAPGPGGSREFFPGSRGNGFIFNKLR